MNADLQKIREARFFKQLPERAFDRIISLVKVKAYEAGETVFQSEKESEYKNSFGYVVRGAVLFVNENSAPLGLSLRDEFFLTRTFTLGDQAIHRLIAIDPRTLVVYIPRDVLLLLAQSSSIVEVIEEIYASIFERAEMIRSDINGGHEVQSWLKFERYDKILANWVESIGQKRQAVIKLREKEKAREKKFKLIHAVAFTICSVFVLGSRLHFPFLAGRIALFFMVLIIILEVMDIFQSKAKIKAIPFLKLKNFRLAVIGLFYCAVIVQMGLIVKTFF